MDIAKKFSPRTILLWKKVADHPEAQRIVNLFPSATIKLIEHQRAPLPQKLSAGDALKEGKRTLMIGQSTNFVGRFDGNLGKNIRCCPYYKLTPLSNGCPYYCTYCYLAFVYRKYSPYIKLNINYDTMLKQISKAVSKTSQRADFNMGEMLDSLALDHITGLTKKLIPFISSLPNASLMLLSKSSNIDNLLQIEPNDHTVLSWSLNTQRNIDLYEIGTASLDQRIAAAKKCRRHGHRIRFRIDPGILYDNWQDDYSALIRYALLNVKPENITIGMLRLLPGHKKLSLEAYGQKAKELLSQNLPESSSDGKNRYSSNLRIEFYNLLIDNIRSLDKNVSISLCRETPGVWLALKDLCTPQKCNCVTW